MASTRFIGVTKKGKCYEIQVSRGYGKSPYSKKWYPNSGWSETYAKQQLQKAAVKFEADCKSGKIKTREQQRSEKSQDADYDIKHCTLEQYAVNTYMATISNTASANTISNYKQLLKTRIVPSMGHKKLSAITSAEISDFLRSIQTEGLSTGTAIKYYTFLNAMFNMAYKYEVIEKNPMEKVDRPKPTKNEGKDKKVEAFTADEVAYIIEKLEAVPLIWKTYIRLMLDTGMRRGECSGLYWEDVDFNHSMITIRRSLNYTSQDKVYTEPPKNGMPRTIDVDKDVLELLKLLKNLQDSTVPSKYVFSQQCSSEPMHPTSPTHFMKKFGKKYGIKDMHPHKLRHTWASIAVTNGADIASVSEKLGHYDAGFTLKQYTHSNAECIKKAGDVFRNAIKKS